MKNFLLLFIVTVFGVSSAYAGTAVVNTPGDGFLALRSEPSAVQGIRLEKIPHATSIVLGECANTSATENWCKTTYQGQTGWVLDKYIIKEHSGLETNYSEINSILRTVKKECPPIWCKSKIRKIIGSYASVIFICKKKECENDLAFLKKNGSEWVLVDQGTGVTSEDLIRYGFPIDVARELE